MSQPVILIQLVSEQTMQNVLAAFALRPAKVVQLVSARLKGRHNEYFKCALEQALLAIPVSDVDLSDMPDVEETRKAARCAAESSKAEGSLPVFNITGGTKMMAIGAYLAAQDAGCPAFYFDSEFGQVRSLLSHPAFVPPSFEQAEEHLTFALSMAAHGKSRDQYKVRPPPSEALRRFAYAAYELRTADAKPIVNWLGEVRKMVRTNKGRLPKRKAELHELLMLDLPDAGCSALEEYLCAAQQADLLRKENGRWHLKAHSYERTAVEHTVNMLDGSWLEVFVYDHLAKSACFRDPQWSFEPVAGATEGWGEIDVGCVDAKRLSFQLFSCKVAVEQQLQALASCRESASLLGGKFAHAVLCVFDCQDPERLRAMGRSLNVDVWIKDEIAGKIGEI